MRPYCVCDWCWLNICLHDNEYSLAIEPDGFIDMLPDKQIATGAATGVMSPADKTACQEQPLEPIASTVVPPYLASINEVNKTSSFR